MSRTVRLRRPRVSARFRRTRRWVCFSDLHLTAASQAVAMEVLERVHAEAVARDAGVLFLGDFWHHRGKLPVEPLNAAVEAFSAWRCPTVMLTGNHDQVSIGGQIHALNALAAAAPRGLVKVVAEPTVMLGALWLPYRRRQEELRRAIVLAERAAGERGETLRTVFCHADLQGAAFNDAFQAAAGLPLSIFPDEAAVWSGHYHKAQVLGGQLGDATSPAYVEYVGSPLELSFAEEDQAKRLLLFSLEAERCSSAPAGSGSAGLPVLARPEYGAWRRTGEIALEIGPRHFSLEAEELAKRLAAGGPLPGSSDADAVTEAVGAAAGGARPRGRPKSGDRVRINIDGRPSAAAEAACEAALAALRASAVACDVMRRPAAPAPRIQGTAYMSPPTLLQAFHAAQGQLLSLDDEDDISAVADREHALEKSQAMLRAVADGSDTAVLAAADRRAPVHIIFDRVVVRGFGPFLTEISYPLRERGVRLVTGCKGSSGKDGAGSNGAGKTALVMAPLWALSGETDPRPDGGSTRGLGGADVIHHAAKEAAVRLEGTANGEQFIVERTAGKRSRSLSFELGGVDHTGQDLALTQVEIDARLVPASLLREVCCGTWDPLVSCPCYHNLPRLSPRGHK